jgi:hypothetical protein
LKAGETPIFAVIRNGGADAKRRADLLASKGADLNISPVCPPVNYSAIYLGQYDLCLHLLKLGASHKIYEANGLQRLIHVLAAADTTHMRSPTPQQQASFDRLVKWLEQRGESLKEAKADRARWAKWSDHFADHRAREIAERKEREQQAAANPKAAD